MKLKVMRDAIQIVPENAQDRAYLEDTLELDKGGATAVFRRVDYQDSLLGNVYSEYYVMPEQEE